MSYAPSTQQQIFLRSNDKLFPLELRLKKKFNTSQCFARTSLVCKFCGMAPVFTSLENSRWKNFRQGINCLFCSGFVALYARWSRIPMRAIDLFNSTLIVAIIENINCSYYMLLLVSVLIFQGSYSKQKKIFSTLDELDNYLEPASITSASEKLKKIIHFLITIIFVIPVVLHFLSLTYVIDYRRMWIEHVIAFLYSLFTQTTYALSYLNAILAVLAVLAKFQKVNRLLR